MDQNTCIVGLQWGDEGKGKIVDLLAQQFDYVVRYGGGANAGHSVVINGRKFAMHLLPSGILTQRCTAVIANGVALDPVVLLEELEYLRSNDIAVDNKLLISDKAHVVFPYHKKQDQLSEQALGDRDQIGTTCRGIGPCYADKFARTTGIRMSELYYPEHFKGRLEQIVDQKNRIFRALYNTSQDDDIDWRQIYDQYIGYAQKLKPYLCETTSVLQQAWRQGKSMLFEGAQGSLLDIDHGTYPYVTSSTSSACGVFAGTGIPPGAIGRYMGVAKAYTTRVGSGPFISELTGQLAEYIRERGNEYGTTTGRARRVGWFDAVAVSYAVAIGGVDSIALMLLDVLAGVDKIKIVTVYKYKGKQLDCFPSDLQVLKQVEPVFEELPGWQEELSKIRRWDQLPQRARDYVNRIATLIGCDIRIISVGPDRMETIFKD